MTEWRWIPEWEGRYEVSDDGRVRSYAKPGMQGSTWGKSRELKSHPNNGYPFVQLWRDNRATGMHIHKAVARAFLPNPEEGDEVRHLDGTRDNNHVSNLEWGSRQQNVDDAVAHGTMLHRAKLTVLEVLAIRALMASREHCRSKPLREDISRAFGISTQSVSNIHQRRTWRHVVD